MVKLPLNCRQVVKDVGMVKFQVVEYRGAGPVVHKLAALVKKSRVVFVGFNDNGLALAESGRDAKVQRHAAHQKAGLQAGSFQDPAGHGRGGGFAVGTGDGNHMATLQHMLSQPLRSADVGQASVKNGFHEREFRRAVGQVRTTDHVAHHEHVGLECELIGAKTLNQLDAQGAKLITHGWVNAGVAAGDFVARFARQCGKPSHEGAADAKNVNVHGGILGAWPGAAGAFPCCLWWT